MLPHHFNPYKRFTTPWIQVHFTSSYTYHFFFVQTSPFQCLSIYVKENPIHALYVGFIKRLGTCFFSRLLPLNRFFSVRKWRISWLFYISPSIFLIKYCMETFVITFDYQSHHCLKDISSTNQGLTPCTNGVLNRMHCCLLVIVLSL